MTYSVPIFGTDQNIPTVPAGTKRSLEPWSGGLEMVVENKKVGVVSC